MFLARSCGQHVLIEVTGRCTCNSQAYVTGFLKGARMEAPPGIQLTLVVLKYLRPVSSGNHLQWIRDVKQTLSGRFYILADATLSEVIAIPPV